MTARAKPVPPKDPLVGLWFVSLNEKRIVEYCGLVRDRIEPDRYLVQLVEWIAGTLDVLNVVPLETLTSKALGSGARSVVFFEDRRQLDLFSAAGSRTRWGQS